MEVVNFKFDVMEGRYQVSASSTVPAKPHTYLVLGHGAGAGMEHSFMKQLSENLAAQGVGSLRYNFPYIEQGRRTPTSPAISEATVRAAVEKARSISPVDKLIVGGKSYGGRMSSQTQSKEPLPGVSGLVFFGFPLHAPGKPGNSRGEHLKNINIPMLFLQGSRDKLADLNLLRPLLETVGNNATLKVIEGADHSFKMLKSAAKTSDQVQKELAILTREWLEGN